MPTITTLPPLREQAQRLVQLGVHELAGLTAGQLLAVPDDPHDALLAVHPSRVPAAHLARLLSHGPEGRRKTGFVVTDLTDLEAFTATPESAPPPADLYLVRAAERGDDLRNWTPDEALPAILAAGRTPLTLHEGIFWLLQQPDALQRNHCFMTIGSRKVKAGGGYDARTPAVWISNGTGRDGAANRGAPKVGWCWAGNRHTWLGFASAAGRVPLVECA